MIIFLKNKRDHMHGIITSAPMFKYNFSRSNVYVFTFMINEYTVLKCFDLLFLYDKSKQIYDVSSI